MQKRVIFILLILVGITAGCSVFASSPATSTPTLSPTATETTAGLPSPTAENTATLVPTLPPTIPPLVFETDLPSLDDFEVRVHPENGLFVGDVVSFEVISPEGAALDGQEVVVTVGESEALARADFGYFGIGNRRQATLQWIWDTAGLEPGDYVVNFSLEPAGGVFTRTFALLPRSLMSFPEPGAAWAVAESDCCLVYYVTGTAADRDLDFLLEVTDAEAESAVAQLGGTFTEPITLVFLPRVLGHGGFAGDEIYISYLDRNYAGNNPAQVIHHELVHILDGRKGGELRPSIFVEGLAVYLSGGHFKKEAIVPRAAAVIDQGTYIPLSDLTENFYFAQHEISYLQGAALIDYMVTTWGWEAFETFYRDIKPGENRTQIEAIDAALSTHFGLTFEALEAGFIDYLNAQPDDVAAADDIRLSVMFFDAVRRYQELLDPSAYFLTAWLLGITEMSEQGIVADYLRHPSNPENIALETMLVAADQELRAGDYAASESLLESVNRVLTRYAEDPVSAFSADPIAQDYLELVFAAQALGYDPQRIFPSDGIAVVYGLQNSVELVELRWTQTEAGWTYGE